MVEGEEEEEEQTSTKGKGKAEGRSKDDKKAQQTVPPWYQNCCSLTGIEAVDAAHIIDILATISMDEPLEFWKPTDWDDMLREALELGILSERTEAIWRKSLLEMAGIGSLKEKEKEERLLIQQSKHDDGHEEQKGMLEGREKGKQKMSISTDKDKGTDHGEGGTLKLMRKLSKLSLKGSYRRLKEAPGKFKRSRVASLFHKPKEEERVGGQE
ncbi:hypothetical protein B0T26DRAFT_807623 [Lasiosphaeria miniovina]|uniref:Uncharacterized protein n=1 Tax=Lasiosphaeria miniovina TaxID=1954250 RepID=A0AA40DFP8_9PEZI|nr:uncharacterized protein B0T26DRAFT_807623 [Lasiosphaeria miniovina]KAK0701734.1 hypothetical protein B0T26DRAFT_807623 [Lasiosphaeria miniovina]